MLVRCGERKAEWLPGLEQVGVFTERSELLCDVDIYLY